MNTEQDTLNSISPNDIENEIANCNSQIENIKVKMLDTMEEDAVIELDLQIQSYWQNYLTCGAKNLRDLANTYKTKYELEEKLAKQNRYEQTLKLQDKTRKLSNNDELKYILGELLNLYNITSNRIIEIDKNNLKYRVETIKALNDITRENESLKKKFSELDNSNMVFKVETIKLMKEIMEENKTLKNKINASEKSRVDLEHV